MISVTTAATHNRLTTISAVRERFGTLAAALDDAVVAKEIQIVSDAIAKFCQRVFARQTYLQTELADLSDPNSQRWGVRGKTLGLERFPIVVDTTLVVTEDTMTLVKDTDYVVDEEFSCLYRMNSGVRVPWSLQPVTVAYQAGWVLPEDNDATLPADVEDAALAEIGARIQRRSMPMSGMIRSQEVSNIGTVEFFAPTLSVNGLLSPDARTALTPYMVYRMR